MEKKWDAVEQLTLSLCSWSQLFSSGVSAGSTAHFCDALWWQVHLFCQLRDEGGKKQLEGKWKRKCSSPLLHLYPSPVPSPPLWLSSYFWPPFNWLDLCQGLPSVFGRRCQPAWGAAPHILMCEVWQVNGGWGQSCCCPWLGSHGRVCRVRVLMLLDLVKSRVTALLPGLEEDEDTW